MTTAVNCLPTSPLECGQELWRRFLEAEATKDKPSGKDENAYKCPWGKDAFVPVTELAEMMKFQKHAAHVMLWCPAKETDMMLDKYPLKFRISMQIRFDGKLGFPGGLVDEMKDFDSKGKDFPEFIETIKKGLIREVREEMVFSMESYPIKYIYSSCSEQQLQQCQNLQDGKRVPGYIMHFFSCQVPISSLESIEKNTLEILSSDEVLGITRVPLYFMANNIGGLPSFITNAFIGSALEELMRACISEGLLTEQEVRFAYFVASIILSQQTQGLSKS